MLQQKLLVSYLAAVGPVLLPYQIPVLIQWQFVSRKADSISSPQGKR